MKWYEDPVYIKQCEKAVEIQCQWRVNGGDFFVKMRKYVENPTNQHIWLGVKMNRIHSFQLGQIWLPRQDQLQEMIGEKDINHLLWRVYRYCNPKSNPHFLEEGSKTFESFEQLWLAFVMKKKYNKVWDSEKEDWVKEA